MFDENETNGVHESNGHNGASVAAPAPKRKRILASQLSARIKELEDKLVQAGSEAPHSATDLEAKIAALTDQVAKLDERVTRIAHAVAQSNLVR